MAVISVSSPPPPLSASAAPTSTTASRQINNHTFVLSRSTTKHVGLRPPPISPTAFEATQTQAPEDLSSPSPSDSDDSDANSTCIPSDVPTDAPTNIEPVPNTTKGHNSIAHNTNGSKKVKQRVEPAPPARPPPMLTVRLDIGLDSLSDYEVNILSLAKATGQRHPTPPPPLRDSDTDSSSDGESALSASGSGLIEKKTRQKNYDSHDAFIDDSSLIIDAPTHFGRAKQQGFYVNSGDVVLVEAKSPVEGKAKRPRSSHLKKSRGSDLTSLLLQAAANATAPTKLPIVLPTLHTATSSSILDPFKPVDPQLPVIPDSSFNNQDSTAYLGTGTRDSPATLDDDDDVPPMISHHPPSPPAHLFPATKKFKKEDGGSAVTRRSHASGDGWSSEDMDTVETNVESAIAMLLSGNEDAFVASTSVPASSSTSTKRTISREDIERFSPDVIRALTVLKRAVQATKFTPGQFPRTLKPLLVKTAMTAIHNGDYTDSFFNSLRSVLPYNKFTTRKLTSRLVFTEHQKFLAERQDQILEELRVIAVQDFENAKEEYARNWRLWDEKEKKKIRNDGGGSESDPNAMDVDTPPVQSRSFNDGAPKPIDGAESSNADSDNPAAPAAKKRQRGEKLPHQKYTWTDDIKARIWGLVHLSNEMCRIQNEMTIWEPEKVGAVNEQSLRRKLYARIVSVFPDGWITSQEISKGVSKMKLKLREAEEAAAEVEDRGKAGPSNHIMDD